MGSAYAPMNPAFSAAEAKAVVTYLKPRALLVDESHIGPGEEIALELQIPLLIVGTSARSLPGINFDHSTSQADVGSIRPADPRPDDTHVIFLTSGSTGRPKGVMLSHYASWMRSVPIGGASRLLAGAGGGEVCMFPLFHMAGWNSLLCAWSLLRPVHFVRRVEGDILLGEIERWRASTLYCIPAVWRRIFDQPGRFDVSSLRYALTGTSLVSQELLHEIKDRFPWTETTVNYGSTEMGVVSSLGDFDLFRKPESIGLPNPGFEVDIKDAELCLRSQTMMSGYFDLLAETEAAFDGDWYRSGDLADIDDEGYMTITGRRNEVIRSGGETIAPTEVEAALGLHPGIQEAAVVGIPDPAWGELVCAVIVLEPGAAEPSLQELRRHLEPRLSSYKHPRIVTCVSDLPRTPATGQVQRTRLRQSILNDWGRTWTTTLSSEAAR
jgi:acyl-CoA synthetase (AMP-forming)/AMP-acid ligase II